MMSSLELYWVVVYVLFGVAQEKLAKMWRDNLPHKALRIILNGRVPEGATYVEVENELSTPTIKDYQALSST